MFFPGYILINMNLNNQSKYVVENTQGVLSFVGPKGSDPVRLTDKEIKRIFGEVRRKEGIVDNVDVPFKKDDHIKVISGPFIDFNGVVEDIDEEKERLKIAVSIFGRSTLVELGYGQVDKAWFKRR